MQTPADKALETAQITLTRLQVEVLTEILHQESDENGQVWGPHWLDAVAAIEAKLAPLFS